MKDKDIFGFGGLWEEWLDKDSGELIETCTIITTEANEVLAPVHNRVPVIIKQNDYEKWLNGSVSNIADLLKPFDANKMSSHTVGKAVNTPTNNSPELILNSK